MTTTKKLDTNLYSKFNQVKINSIDIYRVDENGRIPDQATWFDIRHLVEEINIYEDIFSSSITAQILIADAFNLTDNLPLIGGERIRLSFNTPTMKEEILEWVVYKIGEHIMDTVSDSSGGEMYWLYLCTVDRYQDLNISLSIALTGSYDIIIKKCLESIGSKRAYDADSAIGSQTFIVPYWNPLKAALRCSKRAIDSYTGTMFFYETLDGYNFKSLRNLYRQEPKKKLYIEPTSNTGHLLNSDKVFNTLKSYEYKSSNDKWNQYMEGSFEVNEVYNFNMKNAVISKSNYTYENLFNKGIHLEKYGLYDGMAKGRKKAKFVLEKFDNSHLGLPVKTLLKNTMGNFTVLAEIPGDSSLRCGDIIELDIPSTDTVTRKHNQKIISGKWFITSLRHIIRKDKYTVNLELTKDSSAVALAGLINNG